MKIGILTFHAAHNYGAVLQCYALQEYLKSKGNEVFVIDYRSKYLLDCYKWFNCKLFIKSIVKFTFIKEWKKMLDKRKRSNKFETFIQNRLNIINVSILKTNFFDYIVIGSDQVWNTKLTNGYDKYYWGQFCHPVQTKIISYSASLELIWPKDEDDNVKKMLSNFERISVREKDLAIKLSSIFPNKKIVSCVDPTLLLSKEEWNKIAVKLNIRNRYVLYYQVRKSKVGMDVASLLCKKLKCKLLILSASLNLDNSPECMYASPESFISLVKNAEFVVSSSFHGTVFSIIFEKKFISISNGTKDSRVKNLLTELNMMDHFIYQSDEFLNVNIHQMSRLNLDVFNDYIKTSKLYLDQLK